MGLIPRVAQRQARFSSPGLTPSTPHIPEIVKGNVNTHGFESWETHLSYLTRTPQLQTHRALRQSRRAPRIWSRPHTPRGSWNPEAGTARAMGDDSRAGLSCPPPPHLCPAPLQRQGLLKQSPLANHNPEPALAHILPWEGHASHTAYHASHGRGQNACARPRGDRHSHRRTEQGQEAAQQGGVCPSWPSSGPDPGSATALSEESGSTRFPCWGSAQPAGTLCRPHSVLQEYAVFTDHLTLLKPSLPSKLRQSRGLGCKERAYTLDPG